MKKKMKLKKTTINKKDKKLVKKKVSTMKDTVLDIK